MNQVEFDRFIFTATAFSSPIQRAFSIDQSSGLTSDTSQHFNERSQDIDPAYHDAGQFYWGRPEAWVQSTNLFEGSKPLLMPRWRVQDIDTEED